MALLKELPVWEKLYFVWASLGVKGEDISSNLQQMVKDLDVGDRVKFFRRAQRSAI